MHYGRLRIIMWSGVGLNVGVSALLLVATSWWPIELAEIESNARQSSKSVEDVRVDTKTLKVGDFRDTLGVRLRRPFVEPSAVEPKNIEPASVPTRPPLKLDITLVGTAVMAAPNRSSAWIRHDAGSKSRIINQGERIENLPGEPLVVEIEQRRIVLEVDGQQVVVEMKLKAE